jgi:Zn-dependent peptidase ImmA (M78 family)
LARKRRALTISVLAERTGLSTRRIGAFENGEAIPPEGTISAIALALEFPRSFFSGPDLDLPSVDSASFRALTNMTARQRDAALSAGALAMTLSTWIDERFHLPQVDMPDLRDEDPEPDAAAAALRAQWGLGEQPIRNMVHLLEGHGVRVFSLVEKCVEVDAFSLWRNDVPFVFLNTMKSGERARFDAAHELGHLILHRHGGPQGREAETEADRFASAFLMPSTSVLAHAPRLASIDTLVRLKRVWKVSVAALAYRLRSVGVLSEWHYRQLCIELSERGFRKKEPEGIPRETSQVLNKVFTALREDGVSKAEVARQLSLHPAEVETLVFGLVMLAVDEKGARDQKIGSAPPKQTSLRLVWDQPSDQVEPATSSRQPELKVTKASLSEDADASG